jgi:hypothetical protein
MLMIWLNSLAFALIFVNGIFGTEDDKMPELIDDEEGLPLGLVHSVDSSSGKEKGFMKSAKLSQLWADVADGKIRAGGKRAGRLSQQSPEITQSFRDSTERAREAKMNR